MNTSMIRLWLLLGLASLLTSCGLPDSLRLKAFSVSHFIKAHSTKTQNETKNLPKKQLARYKVIYDFEDWYDELYKHKNFGKIEAFINKNLATDRQDEWVSSRLSRLYDVLGALKDGKDDLTPEDAQQFQKQKVVLDEWIAHSPKSHIPLLLKGILQSDYASEIRGVSYAAQVPEEAWQPFYKNLNIAKLYFEQAAQLNPEDPNVWANLLGNAKSGSLTDKFDEYYQRGLDADPFSSRLRGVMTEILTPKWYGSREKLLKYAKSIDDEARANDKPFLNLAVLAVFREINRDDHGFMQQPEIWAKTQDIYLRLFHTYPKDVRTRFYYAYDAYLTKHYDIAAEQFEIIGDRWANRTRWGSLENYHRARSRTYSQLAHAASEKGNFKQAEALSLKAVELWPTAYDYLFLSCIYGNNYRDMPRTAKYAQLALDSTPTSEERKRAEANLHLAQEILKTNKH
jgi:Tetratricopeptide repeat